MRTGATREEKSRKHCDKCLHRCAGSERAIRNQKVGAIRSRAGKGITISRWCGDLRCQPSHLNQGDTKKRGSDPNPQSETSETAKGFLGGSIPYNGSLVFLHGMKLLQSINPGEFQSPAKHCFFSI